MILEYSDFTSHSDYVDYILSWIIYPIGLMICVVASFIRSLFVANLPDRQNNSYVAFFACICIFNMLYVDS